jgi:hypothetical protein
MQREGQRGRLVIAAMLTSAVRVRANARLPVLRALVVAHESDASVRLPDKLVTCSRASWVMDARKMWRRWKNGKQCFTDDGGSKFMTFGEPMSVIHV